MRTARPSSTFLRACLLGAAFVCGACSSSSSGSPSGGGGSVGSCTIQSGKTCYDYPGSAYTASSVQQACAKLPTGSYSPAACPLDQRVGSCEIFVGTTTEQSVHYYVSGFTPDQAQANCTGLGGNYTTN